MEDVKWSTAMWRRAEKYMELSMGMNVGSTGA
jgi:hypothetical protein